MHLAKVMVAALAIMSTSSAHAERLEKQFKKYMALTPDHFVETATLTDDRLETVATITTQDGFKIKQGLLGIVNDDHFFRAFIDKKSGTVTYQLYQSMRYVGDWAFFEQVNYEGVDDIQSKPLTVVARDVGTCSQLLGCFKTESVAFEVEEAVLQRVAAGYDSSGQGKSGWLFRLKAKSGASRDEGIAPAEAAGILKAVALYKANNGL